jgi:asparaginyl-tRNA synthetase
MFFLIFDPLHNEIMIHREKVKSLLETNEFNREVTVMGWVRTFRNNQFIAINDGSCMGNIQIVVDFNHTPEALLKRITTGAAIAVKGTIVESVGKGQRVDIKADTIEILGHDSPGEFAVPHVGFPHKNSSGRLPGNFRVSIAPTDLCSLRRRPL